MKDGIYTPYAVVATPRQKRMPNRVDIRNPPAADGGGIDVGVGVENRLVS